MIRRTWGRCFADEAVSTSERAQRNGPRAKRSELAGSKIQYGVCQTNDGVDNMIKGMMWKAFAAALIVGAAAAMSFVPAMAQSPGMIGQPGNAKADSGVGHGAGMWGGHGYRMGYAHGWGCHDWINRGYGPGFGRMMGRYAWGSEVAGALGLTNTQQKRIRDIQERLGKRQWAIMRAMHVQMWKVWHSYNKKDKIDAIVDARKAMFDARLQMLRSRLEAQKEIHAVLNLTQRKKLNEMERWGDGYRAY